jgi:hypothetical protein
MPLEIHLPDDDERFSLADYIEHLEQGRYDLADHDDLIASAPYLKKLGNNKDFLIDHVFEELKDCLQFQQSNIYAPAVLLLHATSSYFIRANVWKPITKAEEQVPGYRYDVCHDHNFDILTIGYLGPGYSSRAYSYDRTTCVGMLGETVDLLSEGVFNLTQGKVALYRAKRDVHIQLPPEQLSVSINLIPKAVIRNEPQLLFDEASGTIRRYLDFTGAEVAVRLAGLLESRVCLEPLACIADRHPSAKMRALALVSLLQIVPDRADAIRADLKVSQPALVRHIVDAETARYGACMRTDGTG